MEQELKLQFILSNGKGEFVYHLFEEKGYDAIQKVFEKKGLKGLYTMLQQSCETYLDFCEDDKKEKESVQPKKDSSL